MRRRPYTIAFIKILEEDDKRRVLAQDTGVMPTQEQIAAPMVQIGLIPEKSEISVDWQTQKVVKMPTGTRIITLKLQDYWPNIQDFIEPNDKWEKVSFLGGDLGFNPTDDTGEPLKQIPDGPLFIDLDD